MNPDKTGITGISWGGTLTSTTMGVDNRFKFAIPVYGCGFLPGSDGHQGNSIQPGEQSDIVSKYWDGSAYFNNVSIPTFWVNGTNDKHFPMPSTQESSKHTISNMGSRTLRYITIHSADDLMKRNEYFAHFAKELMRRGKSKGFSSVPARPIVIRVAFSMIKDQKTFKPANCLGISKDPLFKIKDFLQNHKASEHTDEYVEYAQKYLGKKE